MSQAGSWRGPAEVLERSWIGPGAAREGSEVVVLDGSWSGPAGVLVPGWVPQRFRSAEVSFCRGTVLKGSRKGPKEELHPRRGGFRGKTSKTQIRLRTSHS